MCSIIIYFLFPVHTTLMPVYSEREREQERVRVCMHACMRVCVCVCVCVCMCVCVYVRGQVCICACIHVCGCMCVHVNVCSTFICLALDIGLYFIFCHFNIVHKS